MIGSHETPIKYVIKNQTKDLIASNEQLAREQYQILEQIDGSLNDGFTSLSMDISTLNDSINSSFKRMASIYQWGFSKILISLGRVSDTLDDLLKIAKTPAQTWAYEQFEIARDEFRRGLYKEALDSVNRAINGFGSNPGYKTEFRFHFLQGTIQLGDNNNSEPDLIDPTEAEEAFLKSARYASADYPGEAARAMLCAARAAYVQKKASDALKFSNGAIALDTLLTEAYFQAAQAFCALGQPNEGKTQLIKAIVFEQDYALKAASDSEIQQYPDMLDDALTESLEILKNQFNKSKYNYVYILNNLTQTSIDGYSVKNLSSSSVETAHRYTAKIYDDAKKNNIFGYGYALRLISQSEQILQKVLLDFKLQGIKLIEEEQERIRELQSNNVANIKTKKPSSRSAVWIVVPAVSAIGAYIATRRFPEQFISAFIGFSILSTILLFTPIGLVFAIPLIPINFILNSVLKVKWGILKSKVQADNESLQHKFSSLENTKHRIISFAESFQVR